MREIKFRAWNKHQKLMIANPLCPSGWINDMFNTNYGEHTGTDYMQYTGLKDKNGVEIYEGDLYDAWDGRSRYVVEWSEQGAGFHLVWISGDTGDSKVRHYFEMHMAVYQFKHVGNIYENPELPKAKS